MQKKTEKQSRFFCGSKKELLQLLCIFPNYVVCNSYSEISPYYPCLFLGEEFRENDYNEVIFFIISGKKIREDFIYVTEEKLKSLLCDFYGCNPPLESNEPFLSLIYKYSLYSSDVMCSIPIVSEDPMLSIISSINSANWTRKSPTWIYFLKKIRYVFLKTGNQTLGNYINLVEKIIYKRK